MADPAFTLVTDNFTLANRTPVAQIVATANMGTYATDGIAFGKAQIDALLLAGGHKAHETIVAVKAIPLALSADTTTAFVLTAGKLKAIVLATGAEVANNGDLSAAGKTATLVIHVTKAP
jgi:hypothetical protein